jgi:hypothetical protein
MSNPVPPASTPFYPQNEAEEASLAPRRDVVQVVHISVSATLTQLMGRIIGQLHYLLDSIPSLHGQRTLTLINSDGLPVTVPSDFQRLTFQVNSPDRTSYRAELVYSSGERNKVLWALWARSSQSAGPLRLGGIEVFSDGRVQSVGTVLEVPRLGRPAGVPEGAATPGNVLVGLNTAYNTGLITELEWVTEVCNTADLPGDPSTWESSLAIAERICQRRELSGNVQAHALRSMLRIAVDDIRQLRAQGVEPTTNVLQQQARLRNLQSLIEAQQAGTVSSSTLRNAFEMGVDPAAGPSQTVTAIYDPESGASRVITAMQDPEITATSVRLALNEMARVFFARHGSPRPDTLLVNARTAAEIQRWTRDEIHTGRESTRARLSLRVFGYSLQIENSLAYGYARMKRGSTVFPGVVSLLPADAVVITEDVEAGAEQDLLAALHPPSVPDLTQNVPQTIVPGLFGSLQDQFTQATLNDFRRALRMSLTMYASEAELDIEIAEANASQVAWNIVRPDSDQVIGRIIIEAGPRAPLSTAPAPAQRSTNVVEEGQRVLDI